MAIIYKNSEVGFIFRIDMSHLSAAGLSASVYTTKGGERKFSMQCSAEVLECLYQLVVVGYGEHHLMDKKDRAVVELFKRAHENMLHGTEKTKQL